MLPLVLKTGPPPFGKDQGIVIAEQEQFMLCSAYTVLAVSHSHCNMHLPM